MTCQAVSLFCRKYDIKSGILSTDAEGYYPKGFSS